MKLIEYASINVSDVENLRILIEGFKKELPPSRRNFPNNPYVSECYKEKAELAPLASAFNGLIEKLLFPISLRSGNYEFVEKVFGHYPNNKENAALTHIN